MTKTQKQSFISEAISVLGESLLWSYAFVLASDMNKVSDLTVFVVVKLH